MAKETDARSREVRDLSERSLLRTASFHHAQAQQYKAEGDAFKPRYLKILSAGGSKAPADILGEAGIDIRSQAFWQAGFDVLDKLEKQLEGLTPG